MHNTHFVNIAIQDLAIVPFLTPDSDTSSDSSDTDSSDSEQTLGTTLDAHAHTKADKVLSITKSVTNPHDRNC